MIALRLSVWPDGAWNARWASGSETLLAWGRWTRSTNCVVTVEFTSETERPTSKDRRRDEMIRRAVVASVTVMAEAGEP